MKRKKISQAIGEIDMDFIQEALMYETLQESPNKSLYKSLHEPLHGSLHESSEVNKARESQNTGKPNGQCWRNFWQFHRTAACICLVILATAFSFTTAFAASESFRQAVISIFYPLYSDGEIKELQDGHRTSSFDERDVLLTFLDRFNTEEMEKGISAKYDNGYAYILVSSNEIPEGYLDCILAVVESSRAEYRLLVTMEKRAYEETAGIWQIVSYQVITKERAEGILGEMTVYVPAE